jgi:putative PIN family toxin of toxin-antitoxin system
LKVVVDTNVLVSGLLSPYGPPGEIVRMVAAGVLSLCFEARIFSEYSQVLKRPKFHFHPEEVEALLVQIQSAGIVVPSEPLAKRLTDPFDEAFLEAAVAGKVEMLVTGNLKHYPSTYHHVKIVSPAVFLENYRRGLV